MLKKLYAVPAVSGLASLALAVPTFATEVTGSVASASDWAQVISALTAQVNISSIMAALTTFIAAGIGIVFTWWGVRKGVSSLMAAFRKGKISI